VSEASCAAEVPSGYLKHSAPPKSGDTCHVGHAFEVIISIDINQIATEIGYIFYAVLKRIYFKIGGLDLWGHIRPHVIAKTSLYLIAAGF
jgi:hypothetical protein